MNSLRGSLAKDAGFTTIASIYSADTVMILTSRMMMWFLFSQSVLHITGV